MREMNLKKDIDVCITELLCCTSETTASQMVLVVKNLTANAGGWKRAGFGRWVGKMPWRRKWQSTPVFLPDRGAWPAAVHRLTQSWTRVK